MKALCFLLVCFLGLLGAPASASELSSFTCQRPKPWEAGALRNVSVAASLVNSLVLAPGAVFSFNDVMRAGDGRFVKGTSFLAGREVKSVGGGICQVSSGLYNAALLAGLPVLERSSHSLYDPLEAYVLPGRDAMVSREAHSDFRFRNATAAPLTIEATARGGRLDIRLLGTPVTPDRRWIETAWLHRHTAHAVETPSTSLRVGQCALLNRGFDGLTVASRLCSQGPNAVTNCAALGVDRYARVDEVWSVGVAQVHP